MFEASYCQNVAGDVLMPQLRIKSRINLDFETALKSVWDDLVRYSRAIAGGRGAGDDLLQESLMRACRAYPALREPDSFKPWLLTVIRRTHLSLARVGWVKRLAGLEAAAELPAEETLPLEDKEIVRKALRRLPLAQREALILFEVLNYPAAEVAAIQKSSLSAVKSRLARGRERLRDEIARLDPELGRVPSRSPVAATPVCTGDENAR